MKKSPRYEIWCKNLLWGCDWSKLTIGHLRWYLLTVIDFFSRYLIAFDIVPTVNASHVKAVYRMGLKAQGIHLDAESKPELRVDRGSPNTSWVTREFFEIIRSELSFARGVLRIMPLPSGFTAVSSRRKSIWWGVRYLRQSRRYLTFTKKAISPKTGSPILCRMNLLPHQVLSLEVRRCQP